jgi:hypothetical protein
MMSSSIKGWPEGHRQLTKIDGYPIGHSTPQCADPTSEESERSREGTQQASILCMTKPLLMKETR